MTTANNFQFENSDHMDNFLGKFKDLFGKCFKNSKFDCFN